MKTVNAQTITETIAHLCIDARIKYLLCGYFIILFLKFKQGSFGSVGYKKRRL